jgi:hypothetical protein
MIDPVLYRLKQVDYSQQGETIYVIVDGIAKPQTIIYSATDCFGEKYYFTEEGWRYIKDSREERWEQRFVLNHLDKIPTILKAPIIIGKSGENAQHHLYFRPMAIQESHYKKLLFVVVLRRSTHNFVWNFYYVKSDKIPETTEVLFKTKEAKKYLR